MNIKRTSGPVSQVPIRSSPGQVSVQDNCSEKGAIEVKPFFSRQIPLAIVIKGKGETPHKKA